MLFSTWANRVLYVFDFLVLRDGCESIRNFLFLSCGRPWGPAQVLQGGICFSLAIGHKSLDLFTPPLPVRKDDVFNSPLPVRNDVAMTSFSGSCCMASGDIMHQLRASRGATPMENH